MHVDGKLLLDGVGFFVGQGLHPHHGFPFADDLDSPIDAHLAAGRHFDLPHRSPSGTRLPPRQLQRHLDLLLGLQIVVDDCRQDDFVFLDEEPRRLRAGR